MSLEKKLDEKSYKNSKKLIRRVLSASLDNPNNPDSVNLDYPKMHSRLF